MMASPNLAYSNIWEYIAVNGDYWARKLDDKLQVVAEIREQMEAVTGLAWPYPEQAEMPGGSKWRRRVEWQSDLLGLAGFYAEQWLSSDETMAPRPPRVKAEATDAARFVQRARRAVRRGQRANLIYEKALLFDFAYETLLACAATTGAYLKLDYRRADALPWLPDDMRYGD